MWHCTDNTQKQGKIMQKKLYLKINRNHLLTALILILCLAPMFVLAQTEKAVSRAALNDELLENISLMSEVLARIQ